jgi:hypothetical protein
MTLSTARAGGNGTCESKASSENFLGGMATVIRALKAAFGFAILIAAPAVFAQQYTMDLTSAGNGTVAEGVYVSPYVGTISGNGLNYSGFVICDDFYTESYLNQPWTATMSNAGALNGTQKFSFGNAWETQLAYNAAGWLANGLLQNLNNSTAQTNYAFAIWNIFDGQLMNPDGGSLTLEMQAFQAALAGYTASNVSVFTPNPVNASQEFLVVRSAPEMSAAGAASAVTLLLGAVLILRGRRKVQA